MTAQGLRPEPLPRWLTSVSELVTDAAIVYPPMRHEFSYDKRENDEKSDRELGASLSASSASSSSSSSSALFSSSGSSTTLPPQMDPLKLVGDPNHVLLNQVGQRLLTVQARDVSVTVLALFTSLAFAVSSTFQDKASCRTRTDQATAPRR